MSGARFGLQVYLDPWTGNLSNLPPASELAALGVTSTVIWAYYPDSDITTVTNWVNAAVPFAQAFVAATGITDIRLHIMPNPRPAPFHLPTNMTRYTNALTALAGQVAPWVTYWSVGNEMAVGDWTGTVADFATLMQATNSAVKAGNPNALILDSGMPGNHYDIAVAQTMVDAGNLTGALAFFQACEVNYAPYTVPQTVSALLSFLAGPTAQNAILWSNARFHEFAPYYDVLQVHYYNGWQTLQQVYDWVKAQMAANNCVKPIQAWEIGYNLDNVHTYDVNEHARTVVKLLAISAANQDGELTHYFGDITFVGQTLGIYGLLNSDFTYTAVGTAFQTATGFLAGGVSPQLLALPAGQYGYSFSVNGETVYVLWADADALCNLLPNALVRCTDINGEVASNNHSEAVPIGVSPLFVQEITLTMTANVTREKTLRDAFALFLTTYLSAANVQAQFGYDIADMQEQSPVVIIKQGKIQREPKFVGQTQPHVWFYFDIETWVIVGDKNSPAWTSQDVEDELGLIEKKIVDCVADNPRNSGVWDYLQSAAPATAPIARVVGSNKYRVRTIPLKARVIGG